MDGVSDFYEDDEPIEKIRAAFDAGEKFLTGRSASRLEWGGRTEVTGASGIHVQLRPASAARASVSPTTSGSVASSS